MMYINHPPTLLPIHAARAFVVTATCIAMTACLAAREITPDVEPMCFSTADCDGGETCDDNICWGNPPNRSFAARISPPVDSWPELAPTEIRELQIGADGAIQNLAFAETISVTGRVVLDCGQTPAPDCVADESLSARISFTQPSIIPGQPPYTRTVLTEPDVADGQLSFSVSLPRSDTAYEVSIVPLGKMGPNADATLPAAAQAPPARRTLLAEEDTEVEWRLGTPEDHNLVTGLVVNLVEEGLANMQVFAVKSGQPLSADKRISSMMETDDSGAFSLLVPVEYEQFDLIALPLADSSIPSLRVSGRDPDIDAGVRPSDEATSVPALDLPAYEHWNMGAMVMPGYGFPFTYTLPVHGIDSSGDELPISGATVRVTTIISEVGDTVATFSTVAYTDDEGNATLELIPGSDNQNRTYLADIEPLGESEHAIRHGHELDIGPAQGGVLEGVELDRRIAVSGLLFTADGNPALEAIVQARLSPAFRQRLSEDARVVIDALHLPSVPTDQSGRFVLWLDPILADSFAIYDLRMTQTDKLAPVGSLRGVDMSEQTEFGVVELDPFDWPSASYARGPVLNLDGVPVPDAQVRLFEVLRDGNVCEDSDDEPCVSVFRGISDADEDARVMLVLPE